MCLFLSPFCFSYDTNLFQHLSSWHEYEVKVGTLNEQRNILVRKPSRKFLPLLTVNAAHAHRNLPLHPWCIHLVNNFQFRSQIPIPLLEYGPFSFSVLSYLQVLAFYRLIFVQTYSLVPQTFSFRTLFINVHCTLLSLVKDYLSKLWLGTSIHYHNLTYLH